MLIRIAHSPDADDAFMHYGVIARQVPWRGLEFQEILADIETLNQRAQVGTYEVTALSLHAYAYVWEKYALLSSGASLGDGYGPVVIARFPFSQAELAGRRVATPGRWTSARLAFALWQPQAQCVDVPFDQVAQVVAQGEADAGVLIHEGQLTYAQEGFCKVVDLGQWWTEETGTPLPLGGNAIRRDLGAEVCRRVAAVLRDSVAWGLAHRQEALEHALAFARGLDRAQADQFVGMYVNRATLEWDERGKRGVERFFALAADRGLIPTRPKLEFVAP